MSLGRKVGLQQQSELQAEFMASECPEMTALAGVSPRFSVTSEVQSASLQCWHPSRLPGHQRRSRGCFRDLRAKEEAVGIALPPICLLETGKGGQGLPQQGNSWRGGSRGRAAETAMQ